MLMSRYLMTLGTSFIFAFAFGIITIAQTSPSPAPWTKVQNKLKPVSNSFNSLLASSEFFKKRSQAEIKISQSLEPSQVGFSNPSSASHFNPPRTQSEAILRTFRNSGIQSQKKSFSLSQSNSTPALPNVPGESVPENNNNSPSQSPDSLNQPNQQPILPTKAAETLPRNLAPNGLNSSGNPLIFPTNPQEVNTTIRQPITLNQAIELAIQNNKDFQSSRINLEKSQANLEAARSALFPTLSTEFNLSRDNSANTELQNALTTQNAENSRVPIPNLQPESTTNALGSVQLIYNIFSGGERSAQIEKAEKQVRSSRLQVEVISEQTRFDATDRYYALQGTDAQVAIAQASVEDAAQSLRDARLLEQAGLGTRFDVLRAEGDLATANEALTRAISDQRTARRRLVQVLGVGQKVELTSADPITEAGDWTIPLENSIIQAYKNRAELEQQLLQMDIFEQDRFIALSGIQPKVDFLANYNYQNNFSNSVGLVDGYSFAARVRWTFFDGGRAFAEARRANRDMDLAQTEFAKQRDQIRFDVEESYYTLTSTKENISSTRTNVTRFEEALRLARLRFQAGVGTQTDVINAQRDLANARGRYLQAIIGYNQALNRIQRAVSNLPDNNLFQIR